MLRGSFMTRSIQKVFSFCLIVAFALFLQSCVIKKVANLNKGSAVTQSSDEYGVPYLTPLGSSTPPDTDFFKPGPASFSIDQAEISRLDYRSIEYKHGSNIVVDATLPNGKVYPVWVDSGMALWPVLVNDIVASENGLQVYSGQYSSNDGVCKLHYLNLGNHTIRDLPCLYTSDHWEFNVFGMPLWKDKRVVLGLEVMAKFNYLYFDNHRRVLELSTSRSFQPQASDGWASYPFELKDMGSKQGRRLIVDLPIQGKEFRFEFDTGGGDVFVNERIWNELKQKLVIESQKPSTFISYQFGKLPCKLVRVKRMTVGNTVVDNATINVLSQDCPYLYGSKFGTIGIEYFKDTRIALDFERNLLWIQRSW